MQTIRDFEDGELTFDEQWLREKFKFIGKFQGIPVFDAEHAEDRWYERFAELSWEKVFLPALRNGIKKAFVQYGRDPHTYMIYSKTHGFKIPIDIRPDRKDRRKLIGVLSTVLDADEHSFNKRGETEVYVEGLQKEIDRLKEETRNGGYAVLHEVGGDPLFQHVIRNGEDRTSHRVVEVGSQ